MFCTKSQTDAIIHMYHLQIHILFLKKIVEAHERYCCMRTESCYVIMYKTEQVTNNTMKSVACDQQT